MKLEQYAIVEATFSPQRTDDLQPGVAEFIGKRGRWMAGWIIEDGPYKGQWAMTPRDYNFPAAWTPECDLSDVQEVEL